MKLRNVLVPVDLFEMACDFIEGTLKDAGSDPSEDEIYMKLKNILTVAEGVLDD